MKRAMADPNMAAQLNAMKEAMKNPETLKQMQQEMQQMQVGKLAAKGFKHPHESGWLGLLPCLRPHCHSFSMPLC